MATVLVTAHAAASAMASAALIGVIAATAILYLCFRAAVPGHIGNEHRRPHHGPAARGDRHRHDRARPARRIPDPDQVGAVGTVAMWSTSSTAMLGRNCASRDLAWHSGSRMRVSRIDP